MTEPTHLILVDDNDQPLTFTEPTPEDLAQRGRAADLYHAYQLGEEAGQGDPWCAAIMERTYGADLEALAEYKRGFQFGQLLKQKENK